MNTNTWRTDNPPRTRTCADDLADLVECATDGDGISVRLDLGPAVIRELERRGHRVERYVYRHDGEPRLAVRVDRVPA